MTLVHFFMVNTDVGIGPILAWLHSAVLPKFWFITTAVCYHLYMFNSLQTMHTYHRQVWFEILIISVKFPELEHLKVGDICNYITFLFSRWPLIFFTFMWFLVVLAFYWYQISQNLCVMISARGTFICQGALWCNLP